MDSARPRATFAVLAASMLAFSLLQSLIVPVMVQIQEHFEVSQSTTTWVLTAYLISASVFTPMLGRIGDAVGKNRMLVIALLFLCIGSALAAVSPSIEWMIVARILQGVGGGVIPLSFGIARDIYPPAQVARSIGVLSSLMAVGMGVGIVIAGPIIDFLGYSGLFWTPAVVSALVAFCAWKYVPRVPGGMAGRINPGSFILLVAWLVPLMLSISKAPQWGWLSPITLALAGFSIAAMACWVFTELKTSVPLIDIRMMRQRPVAATNTVALLAGMGMFATFSFIPQFAQTPAEHGFGFGVSVTEAGLMSLPTAVATFATGLFAARLAQMLGERGAVALGCLVSAAGLTMLAFVHDEKWHIYVSNGIIGLGFGCVFACLASLIVASVPREQTGVASGMNANIRTIGGATGTAAVSSVLLSHTDLLSGYPDVMGYQISFLLLAAAVTVATLLAFTIPKRPPIDSADTGTGPAKTSRDSSPVQVCGSAPASQSSKSVRIESSMSSDVPPLRPARRPA